MRKIPLLLVLQRKLIPLQEMKELAALAYRDTSSESRDFWKNEMAQAIREIEGMYADKLETMKTEMESSYNLKVSRSSPSRAT